MIEKGRPHFNGVSHAHAVHLHQDVVGQKIFLIEPQVRSDAISTERTLTQFAQDAIQRVGKRRMQQGAFLGRRESSIPIDVRLVGGHQTTFEKALELVLEADLFVRDGPVTQSSKGQTYGTGRQAPNAPRESVRSIREVAAEDLVR